MDDVAAAPVRYRLDVDTFHRMAEIGVFGEDDRIELIDGDLIDIAPIGQGHAAIVNALAEALFIACAGQRAAFSWQREIAVPCTGRHPRIVDCRFEAPTCR